MDFSQLIQSPLFIGLSSREAEELISAVPFRVRKFRAGTLIAQAGEQVNSVQIVLSGLVKGEMVDEAGRVIKIEEIPASGTLAAAFIFGSRNRFPVNVAAMEESEILAIDKSDFLKLLMKNDRLLINFLNMISSRSQFLSEKIRFLSFRTIREKMAHFILQVAGSGSAELTLNKTQSDLADLFGVARPSVSRALGELEEMGLITAAGKRIRILDRNGLAELTSE